MDDQENKEFNYSSDEDHGVTNEDKAKYAGMDPVVWTASEYIAHNKSLSWYVMLGLAVSFGVLIAIFLLKDIPSAIAVGVIGIIFGVFAARPPKELEYRIDDQGLSVGQRLYQFEQFKSFAVVQEGPVRTILFTPLKRFSLPISIYYAPEDEQKITEALSQYLPYEERKNDVVDRAMRKIRF